MNKKSILTFLAAALMTCSLWGQLSIQSVNEVTAYRTGEVEVVEANGSGYFFFEGEPQKVKLAIISIGEEYQWIAVNKVGDVNVPIVLDAVQEGELKGKFVYEHQGPGVYHIFYTGADGRPFFDKFEIEGEVDQPEDPEDPEDPPTGDHDQFYEFVKGKKPNEVNTCNSLAAAYKGVIEEASNDNSTLEQVKLKAEAARREAFRMSPPFNSSQWSAFLLECSPYLLKQTSKADYLAALSAMAKALEAAPGANSPPAVSSLHTEYVPAQVYNGVPFAGHYRYR